MKCFNLPSISLVYFKIARHFQNTQCATKEEKWKVNQIGRKTKTFKYRFDAGKIDLFKFNYQERWDSIMRSETLFISLSSQYNWSADSGWIPISWNILNFCFDDITFNQDVYTFHFSVSNQFKFYMYFGQLKKIITLHVWYWLQAKLHKEWKSVFKNISLLHIVRLHKVQCSRY